MHGDSGGVVSSVHLYYMDLVSRCFTVSISLCSFSPPPGIGLPLSSLSSLSWLLDLAPLRRGLVAVDLDREVDQCKRSKSSSSDVAFCACPREPSRSRVLHLLEASWLAKQNKEKRVTFDKHQKDRPIERDRAVWRRCQGIIWCQLWNDVY